MKIYIAGKIAGDRRYRAKFREAAKVLEAAGPCGPEPRHPAGRIDRRGLYADLHGHGGRGGPGRVPAGLPGEPGGAMVEWAYCQRIGKDCAMYLDMKKGE